MGPLWYSCGSHRRIWWWLLPQTPGDLTPPWHSELQESIVMTMSHYVNYAKPLRHAIVTQPCLLLQQCWISCDCSLTLYECLLESLCWAGTRNLWLNLGPESQETLIIQVNYIYTRSHATDVFCTQVPRDPRFLILMFCVAAVYIFFKNFLLMADHSCITCSALELFFPPIYS